MQILIWIVFTIPFSNSQDSLREAKLQAVRYYYDWQSELTNSKALEGRIHSIASASDSIAARLRIAKIKVVKYYHLWKNTHYVIKQQDSLLREGRIIIDSLSKAFRGSKILAVSKSASLVSCRQQLVKLDLESTAQINTEIKANNLLRAKLQEAISLRKRRFWLGMGIGAGGVSIALLVVLIALR